MTREKCAVDRLVWVMSCISICIEINAGTYIWRHVCGSFRQQACKKPRLLRGRMRPIDKTINLSMSMRHSQRTQMRYPERDVEVLQIIRNLVFLESCRLSGALNLPIDI